MSNKKKTRTQKIDDLAVGLWLALGDAEIREIIKKTQCKDGNDNIIDLISYDKSTKRLELLKEYMSELYSAYSNRFKEVQFHKAHKTITNITANRIAGGMNRYIDEKLHRHQTEENEKQLLIQQSIIKNIMIYFILED